MRGTRVFRELGDLSVIWQYMWKFTDRNRTLQISGANGETIDIFMDNRGVVRRKTGDGSSRIDIGAPGWVDIIHQLRNRTGQHGIPFWDIIESRVNDVLSRESLSDRLTDIPHEVLDRFRVDDDLLDLCWSDVCAYCTKDGVERPELYFDEGMEAVRMQLIINGSQVSPKERTASDSVRNGIIGKLGGQTRLNEIQQAILDTADSRGRQLTILGIVLADDAVDLGIANRIMDDVQTLFGRKIEELEERSAPRM